MREFFLPCIATIDPIPHILFRATTMRSAKIDVLWLIAVNTSFLAFLGTSGCSTMPHETCGPPFVEYTKRPVLPDPYNRLRRFQESSAEFKAAVTQLDVQSIRNTASHVCHDAISLRSFTKEVDPELRPHFLESLDRVLLTATAITRSAENESPEYASFRALIQAGDEFATSVPKFWFSIAASLRGRDQPGSPLWTHK